MHRIRYVILCVSSCLRCVSQLEIWNPSSWFMNCELETEWMSKYLKSLVLSSVAKHFILSTDALYPLPSTYPIFISTTNQKKSNMATRCISLNSFSTCSCCSWDIFIAGRFFPLLRWDGAEVYLLRSEHQYVSPAVSDTWWGGHALLWSRGQPDRKGAAFLSVRMRSDDGWEQCFLE